MIPKSYPRDVIFDLQLTTIKGSYNPSHPNLTRETDKTDSNMPDNV